MILQHKQLTPFYFGELFKHEKVRDLSSQICLKSMDNFIITLSYSFNFFSINQEYIDQLQKLIKGLKHYSNPENALVRIIKSWGWIFGGLVRKNRRMLKYIVYEFNTQVDFKTIFIFQDSSFWWTYLMLTLINRVLINSIF